MAVTVESFGYDKAVPVNLVKPEKPENRFTAIDEAREEVKKRKRVVGGQVSWVRTNDADTEFGVTHPRLYYSRTYVFILTFYERVNTDALKKSLSDKLKGILVRKAGFTYLVKEGLSGEKLRARIMEIYKEAISASPPEYSLIDRDSHLPASQFMVDLQTETINKLLSSIAEYATIQNSKVQILKNEKEVKAIATEDFWKGFHPHEALVENLKTLIEGKDWSGANGETARLLQQDPVKASKNTREKIEQLVPLLANLSVATAALKPAPDPQFDSAIEETLQSFPRERIEKVLSAVSTAPNLETMKERYPYILSLDGGLIYPFSFREIIPTVGINIKLLNVHDFDDPLAACPEISVVLGFGMTAPDDIDPDYRGIFGSTGDRSLALGVGLRFPRVSPLLRLQGGVLLFKQENKNPLVDDLETNMSGFVGLSINWDALDAAAKLFANRSNVDF